LAGTNDVIYMGRSHYQLDKHFASSLL
jgi:hypothetical protein